ncbi:MAG TPA: hypothetical protein VF832_12110 [Longimicrobiales bacterium]
MLDWPLVGRSALWLLGLSIALAAWSHATWWAGRQGLQLRAALDRPLFVAPFSLGMVLFCAGLAWGETLLWRRGLWLLLLLAFLWQALAARRAAPAP